MASGRDKIEATVNAVVGDVASVESAFVVQIPFELRVDVFQNRLVALAVVDRVPVARRVYHRQA